MRKGFTMPVESIPVLIGSVIVIGILAFIFLVSSGFIIDFMSDNSATSSFSRFIRTLSSACVSSGDTLTYYEFKSVGISKYYAMSIFNGTLFDESVLDPRSRSKIKECSGYGDGLCMCLFKIVYPDEVLFLSTSHPCPSGKLMIISDNLPSADVLTQRKAYITSWTNHFSSNVAYLLSQGVEIKVLNCRSIQKMKCKYIGPNFELSYLPIIEAHNSHNMIFWFQSLGNNGDWFNRVWFDSVSMVSPVGGDYKYFMILRFSKSIPNSLVDVGANKNIYTTASGGGC